MKVKVCGLNNPSSISELNKVGIDFMGFIFFKKSPRFISKDLILSNLSKQKVGVFVNEIDGVPNGCAYWQLLYNGNASSLGASSLKLEDNDSITWKYNTDYC